MFDYIDTVSLGMLIGFVALVLTIMVATIFGIKDILVHRSNSQYSMNLAQKINDRMVQNLLADTDDYLQSVDQTFDMLNPQT